MKKERKWTSQELKEELERCQKIINDYELENNGVLKLGLFRSNTNPGISLMGVNKLIDNQITIPDFVTRISSFGKWNNDEDIIINLGSGITDYNEIFRNSLFKNLDVSNWDISKIDNLKNLFASSKINNLKGIGNWDLSNHTELVQVFRSAKIENLDLSGWDVSNITNMLLLFSSAEITNLNVSNWNLSSLETTANSKDSFGKSGLLFREAKITNLIGIDKWDISKLDCLVGWFGGAEISNLDLSNWDVSNITNMCFLFEKFKGNLNIDNWNVSKVKNMLKVFNGTKSTSTLNINEWDVSSVENMERLFSNTSISNIDISNWNVSNVTNMESIFDACKIKEIGDLSNWNVSKVKNFSFAFRKPIFKSVGMIGNWNVCNSDVTQMFYSAQLEPIGSVEGWKNNKHQEYMFQASSLK
ncbi:MAG: BspA family leucine-rich repeat surface protein [bacterium]